MGRLLRRSSRHLHDCSSCHTSRRAHLGLTPALGAGNGGVIGNCQSEGARSEQESSICSRLRVSLSFRASKAPGTTPEAPAVGVAHTVPIAALTSLVARARQTASNRVRPERKLPLDMYLCKPASVTPCQPRHRADVFGQAAVDRLPP